MLGSRAEKLIYAALVKKKIERISRRKIDQFYPDTGPLRRELYKPHMACFAAGAHYRERLVLAANRIGKTESIGLYELTCHLTGEYPPWWVGCRWDRPISAWACGDTGKTVREILQTKLLGPIGQRGTGLIPGDLIERVTSGSGVADSVDTIFVKHSSGGTSSLTLKSYDQREESFRGTEKDIILLDEEPPMGVYIECLLRTMTNNGKVLLTFTPLEGTSEVVLSFLPGGSVVAGVAPNKYVIMAEWDDVPHLTEADKAEMLSKIPPYQRDARSKGVPQLGSGAIYPVAESDFAVDDFPIPAHWLRVFGLDVGWRKTACVWAAQDPDTRTWYLYAEHYEGLAEPSEIAQAIMARGSRIPGVVDPAARGRSQSDGKQLLSMYSDLGLDLTPADNSVHSGVNATWDALSGGTLKVFKSLVNWFAEFRVYQRDKNGKIVKTRDHLMDGTRYLVTSGFQIAATGARDFRLEWLKHYAKHDVLSDNLYLLVVPQGAKRGYVALVSTVIVIAAAADGNFYLIDLFSQSMTPVERSNLVIKLHRHYRPLGTIYDPLGWESDRGHMMEVMRRGQYQFEPDVIKDLSGSFKQEDRIRRLAALFESGRMILPERMEKNIDGKTIDLVDELIEREYLVFPISDRRAVLDCLSRLLDIEVFWPSGRYGGVKPVTLPEWTYDT